MYKFTLGNHERTRHVLRKWFHDIIAQIVAEYMLAMTIEISSRGA